MPTMPPKKTSSLGSGSRVYVVCPSCEAHEPLKLENLDQLDGGSPITQRCTICSVDVLITEATTYLRRPPLGPA